MAKSRKTINTTLPTYQKDRQQWRRDILDNVLSAALSAGVQYGRDDHLEVVVLLYLKKGKRLVIHDVDNRLKDILDALQGKFRGSKSFAKTPLIGNDNQIYRVLIEKQQPPKRCPLAGGRLLIRPYQRHRWPLQATKHRGLAGFRLPRS
jgi:Holliday junction resolvase RusA-like endonuclease